MRRFYFWLIVFSLAGLGALLYFKFTLPQQDSTVYLKDNSPPVQGHVTKKDDYIIVTTGGSERLIPWDEVKSVSGPNPLRPELSRFSFWVDKIDFLSSLGVVAALVVFSVGLYQYQQGLVWKREEFLAGLIKNFGDSPRVQNARAMLEVLIQYGGDDIELYPERGEGKSGVHLSSEDIIKSLNVPLERPTAHAPRIRKSIDTFLDYFERFEHYIRTGVVSKKSLQVHVGYWIDILGTRRKLAEDHRIHIINYALYFDYDGVIRLLNRYNRPRRFWDWVVSLFRRSKPGPRGGHPKPPPKPDFTRPPRSGSGDPKAVESKGVNGGAVKGRAAPKVVVNAVAGFLVLRRLFKARGPR